MFRPYREILTTPGALAFSSAGALARLPSSMVTISVVLLVTHVYDEYALAGRVAAAYVIAQALCAPQLAKLIDSYGQARVMRPALAIAAASLSALTALALTHAAEPLLHVAAAVAGATIGSMGALVRSRWTRAVSSPRHLHVAFSLESAIDELAFVIGPVLATTLATSVSPVAGLLVAISASLVGGFWFLGQRRTEPPAAGRRADGIGREPIASVPLVLIALACVGMGIIFGASDVATVAYTAEMGRPALAGVLLAVFALGSLIAGLVYGAQHFRSATWKRFVLGMVLLAAATSVFVFVSSPWLLGLAMFLAGLTIAPTLIAANALVQELVPAKRLTEGLTWISTSLGVGFAVGTSASGSAVDAGTGHDGFIVVVGAAAVAMVVTLLTAPALHRAHQRTQ